MKLIKNTRNLFLLSMCLASTLVLGAEKDGGFVSIFDGKTLKGWTPVSTQAKDAWVVRDGVIRGCLLYTSPSPRDRTRSRMPSSA